MRGGGEGCDDDVDDDEDVVVVAAVVEEWDLFDLEKSLRYFRRAEERPTMEVPRRDEGAEGEAGVSLDVMDDEKSDEGVIRRCRRCRPATLLLVIIFIVLRAYFAVGEVGLMIM